MKKKLWKVECEWDLGITAIYDDREELERDVKNALVGLDLIEEGDSYESLVADGYVSIVQVKRV